MSALAAVIGNGTSTPQQVVRDMLGASPHRGHQQVVVEVGGAVVGVAARSESDHAVARVLEGTAVAFSGVLDNRTELALELGVPATADVADVVLRSLRAWGDAAPAHFRGCFSAVVTDGRTTRAFRDQLGFGPLFYRVDRARAVFASEAKQVIVGAGIPREPDLEVVESIFYQNVDDGMPSSLRGVERLGSASLLRTERGITSTERYWRPESLLETARLSDAELQERFDALMAQAAQRVVTGHDAVSLSGGVDSPAVAAYAAPVHLQAAGQPLLAVTTVYPNHPSVDERPYTQLVADRLGLPLHAYEQTSRPLDDLGEWMRLTDGPVPSIALPLYEEHYRKVRSLGATTVLSGEIAEFVFDLPGYLLVHLLTHRRWRALSSELRRRRSHGTPAMGLARQLAAALVPVGVTRRRWAARSQAVPPWLDRARVNESAARSAVPARDRWSAIQTSAFSGPGITAEADEICQQKCDVRARRPFADVDLWELFLSLPAEQKYPEPRHKSLVRKMLRGRVPDEILDRRDKTVFDASVSDAMDYSELDRWLIEPSHRLGGVDYAQLRDRLERRQLTLNELLWAKDLAATQAFLAQW